MISAEEARKLKEEAINEKISNILSILDTPEFFKYVENNIRRSIQNGFAVIAFDKYPPLKEEGTHIDHLPAILVSKFESIGYTIRQNYRGSFVISWN
jgi:hypothetical protein